MLDSQLLRKDLESVKTRLATRKFELDTSLFTQLESERKQLQGRTEELQAKRNQLAKAIGMKKGKGEDATSELAESATVNKELEASASRLSVLQDEIKDFLLGIPNMPDESVPVGKTADENKEMKSWGKPTQFEFTPKDHVDLGTPIGLDFSSATKISGARFVVLKGNAAKLHRALAQFMLDVHTSQHDIKRSMYLIWSMRIRCTVPDSSQSLRRISLKSPERWGESIPMMALSASRTFISFLRPKYRLRTSCAMRSLTPISYLSNM